MGEADLPVRDLHRLRCVLPQASFLPLGVRNGVHGDVPPDAGTGYKPTASRRANRRLLVQRKHTPVQSEHTRYHVAATMRRRLPCTGAVANAATADATADATAHATTHAATHAASHAGAHATADAGADAGAAV